MKKFSLMLIIVSFLMGFQIKYDSEVQVNMNTSGDFNVTKGDLTVENGYINSVNKGAYIKIKPKDTQKAILYLLR